MDLPFETTELPENPKINVLLYGPPKSGKTAAAGSAPPGVLLINGDVGNATRYVRRKYPDGRIIEPRIPRFKPGEEQVYELLLQVAKLVEEPQDIIQTVVLDPVGEIYRRMLEERSNRAIRPSLPAYGDISVHLERMCRHFCENPYINVVFVCHELAVKNESAGEVDKVPFTGTQAGSAVLGQKLQGMVDIVAYAGVKVDEQTGTKRYMARLFPFRGSNGGDRFNCLGDFVDLDIAKWVETIKAYERGDQPAQEQVVLAPLTEREDPPEPVQATLIETSDEPSTDSASGRRGRKAVSTA